MRLDIVGDFRSCCSLFFCYIRQTSTANRCLIATLGQSKELKLVNLRQVATLWPLLITRPRTSPECHPHRLLTKTGMPLLLQLWLTRRCYLLKHFPKMFMLPSGRQKGPGDCNLPLTDSSLLRWLAYCCGNSSVACWRSPGVVRL